MKTKEPFLVLKMHKMTLTWKIRAYWVALTFQNQCFCGYRCVLSTFSWAFYPRGESATFIFARHYDASRDMPAC